MSDRLSTWSFPNRFGKFVNMLTVRHIHLIFFETKQENFFEDYTY